MFIKLTVLSLSTFQFPLSEFFIQIKQDMAWTLEIKVRSRIQQFLISIRIV
ncbi:hypothetical protein INE86_03704 [Parabacteroides distasonis]|nr:hypothetical protein INE86_03704 [Parabacteroides distasonis]